MKFPRYTDTSTNTRTMNTRFSGAITINRFEKKPNGYASEAAKAAFKDILEDDDMRVSVDIHGCITKQHVILSEKNILNID